MEAIVFIILHIFGYVAIESLGAVTQYQLLTTGAIPFL